MNMSIKPDEQKLWESFGEEAKYRTPREANKELNIPEGRLLYLCNKWTTKGLYDYGTSADLGWKIYDNTK